MLRSGVHLGQGFGRGFWLTGRYLIW